MNKKQKIVLLSTAGVLILMLLFPPFQFVGRETYLNKDYSYIFRPPYQSGRHMMATVNVETLLAQFIIILAVGDYAF